MVKSNQPPQRQWGKTPIAGGRNAFRMGLIARELGRRVPPPARVLDAGCGDGSLSLRLLRAGYRVTAVDAAAGGLDRFQLEVSAGAERGEWAEAGACCLQASLTALPLLDRSFEAVVSGEVLEHLADDGAAAREIHRVLIPGGICVISVPANPYLFNLEDEWAGHLRRYTRAGIAELFAGNGFEIVTLHYWGWPVTWVYSRLVPIWLRRQIQRGQSDPDARASAAGHPAVMAALSYAFAADRLFTFLPFGLGFIGAFRKK